MKNASPSPNSSSTEKNNPTSPVEQMQNASHPVPSPQIKLALEEFISNQANTLSINIFLQGVITCLPWNIFMFAHDYFKVRLSAVPCAVHFIEHFAIIFMSVKFIFLILGVWIAERMRPGHQISISMLSNVLVFLMVSIVCMVEEINGNLLYACILILVLLSSLCSAFIETAFLSLLSAFPSKYTQKYLLGHGFSGVAVAVFHISTTLSTEKIRSFPALFFGTTLILQIAGLIMFEHLKTIDLYRAHQEAREKNVLKKKADGDKSSHAFDIFSTNRDLIIAIFILTCSGMIISPFLIFTTQSTAIGTSKETIFHRKFFNVTALLISSVADLIGKSLPGFEILSHGQLPFTWLALGRALVIPIMFFGNIKLDGYTLAWRPFLASDVFFMLLVAFKAMSGGYLGTLCMLWAPMKVSPVDRAKAVSFMVYSIGLGLLSGSLLALLIKIILESLGTKSIL